MTQWSYAPSGIPTGLRYADCAIALQQIGRTHGIADTDMADVFAGLQVIERAFVAAHIELQAQARRDE